MNQNLDNDRKPINNFIIKIFNEYLKMKRLYRFIILYIATFMSLSNLNSQPIKNLIPPQIVKDTFYGKVVEDPYRFMENTEDTMVLKWLHKQSDKTLDALNKIPNLKSIVTKQKKINEEISQTRYLVVTNSNDYFYLKKDADERIYKLYYRNGFHGTEELLFDPMSYDKGSDNKYIINYIQPSWDASKIVIGFTKNDEEFSEMIVLEVKTKKTLSEVISHCWPSDLGGVSWLKDNSGFYYLHIPVINKNSEGYLLNASSVLYKLSDDPKKLNTVFSANNNPKINCNPADFPIVDYKPYYGNILIGRIGGASTFQDYYYTQTDKKGSVTEWVPLFKKEDKVTQLSFNGKDFYFLSALNSPNYKLCKTSFENPDFQNPEILVEEGIDIITDFAITKNGVYYVKNKNGVDAQLYHLKNGKNQKIKVPKQSGDIILTSKSPDRNELWIEIEGWTINKSRYRFAPDQNTFIHEDLYPKPYYPELEDAVIEEIEVVSHDGVKVPLSIVYKKGIEFNGKNPVLMNGYGAFGYSHRPYLSSLLLHWLDRGGVFATAHVRGGGEKGEAWQKGGFKQTKPNTWKDFIACAEYLVEKKYTNPDKIAILGSSAGGILIARSITERPDLFRAAIIFSGKINMLRAEFGPNGKNTIKEYGTVNDSSEFQALLKMDACQHIKNNTKYPAVLLQAGANDSRVPEWHSSKFAAALMAANVSDNPILLSIDFGGGHGLNLAENKRDQNIVNIISFALWQTGHPDFQLKE